MGGHVNIRPLVGQSHGVRPPTPFAKSESRLMLEGEYPFPKTPEDFSRLGRFVYEHLELEIMKHQGLEEYSFERFWGESEAGANYGANCYSLLSEAGQQGAYGFLLSCLDSDSPNSTI